MCLLAGVAYPLVELLIGEKWRFAATLIIPLSFTMMWWPIHAINLNLLQVKGRSDLFLKLEIIKKTIGVTVLVLSIPFGLLFMCYAGIVTSLLCLIINTYYTGKLIQVGFLMQMKDLSSVLFTSLSIFAIAYCVTQYISSILLQLIIGCVLSVSFFVSVVYFLKFKELRYIKSLIRE